VLDSRAKIWVGQHRRAEDLMEPVQPERGQHGQSDQHAHRSREDDQAGGEAVDLTARQPEDGGCERRDDQAKAQSANGQRDVGLALWPGVKRELIGGPA